LPAAQVVQLVAPVSEAEAMKHAMHAAAPLLPW
jgi:hypothetical protein